MTGTVHSVRAVTSSNPTRWIISVGRSQLDDRLIVRCATTARRVIERKRRLAKLLGQGQQTAIQYNGHLAEDGITVFAHACRMGLEGIVSKRMDSRYTSGPSHAWRNSKNPAREAVQRETEGDFS